jgi:superfamily I DNA and/or RNA helicase
LKSKAKTALIIHSEIITNRLAENEKLILERSLDNEQRRKKIVEYNEELGEYLKEEVQLDDAKATKAGEFYHARLDEKYTHYKFLYDTLNDWIGRIENKKYGDKDSLEKLYMETANVIAITCSQSGRSEFLKTYPEFDIVVIDEVTKATPPELILPMLHSKKIVLIGDYKQLPPMLGDETFAELKKRLDADGCNPMIIDRWGNERAQSELDYMQNSIFNELFTNAHKDNKVYLNTQYRMHSSIMAVINQFYGEVEEGTLISGILDIENESRAHSISTDVIKESDHLIWVDMPRNTENTETFHDPGYSNEREAEAILRIVEGMDKDAGKKGERWKIAIITFYSKQKKLLRDKIPLAQFQNLAIRINTVDRFQGAEAEIVIVSFVRNNDKRKIGFADRPERINVALSRAQKLLIIVGCSELFCKETWSESRLKYENVYKTVRLCGRFVKPSGEEF